MMINRFRRFLQSMFAPLHGLLSVPRLAYRRWMILGLGMRPRKAQLTHLAGIPPKGGHRTSRGSFRAAAGDAPALLADQVLRMWQSMRRKKRETLYLLIDDTRITKRGKKMEAVSKIGDRKKQCFARGHLVVTAALVSGGVVLPWRISLWLPRSFTKGDYQKIIQIAAEMMGQLEARGGLKVRMLLDTFYLAPCVVRACENKGFPWFSVASQNRKLSGRKEARKKNIRDFAPRVLKHHGQRVRLRRSRGWRWLRIAAVDGSWSRLGRVRMVLSKRPGDPWKNVLAVVTKETQLKAREIIAIYEKRWQIEVLFKKLRESLGLGDYQVIGRDAMERHLHLVCLSHLLLTHHSLEAAGAKARMAKTEIDLPSINERLAALREAIRREQLQGLVNRTQHRKTKAMVKKCLLEELQLHTAV